MLAFNNKHIANNASHKLAYMNIPTAYNANHLSLEYQT